MNRWVWFFICVVVAVVTLMCGLLVPIHLRAVDAKVLATAGAGTPDAIEHGLVLVRDKKLGAAMLENEAATKQEVPGAVKLSAGVNELISQEPILVSFGGDAEGRLQQLFVTHVDSVSGQSQPLTRFVIRLENRDDVLKFLRNSSNQGVQELLRCQALTNLTIFSPSVSASGQAFDAATAVTGLLLEENRLTPALSNNLFTFTAEANRGAGSQPLEESLLDFMSLGQRFNWGQLAAFSAHIGDADTLHILANESRRTNELPVLFTAVEMSGKPAAVAHYMTNFSRTGLADLGASLQYGTGGLSELLKRDERVWNASDFAQKVAVAPGFNEFYKFSVGLAAQTPGAAFVVKWFCYFLGGFLLAFALHFARPAVSELERPLEVRGFHVAREILFALGFLVVVLLMSEPFLSQESQPATFPFHVRFPVAGNIVPAKVTQTNPLVMNQISLLTFVLFFVLQGLLYVCSVLKLAEIRRQNVPSRIKLRLLENEDHLFDAGLYLGFVGTIISLIMASLHVIQPSLMAAYSSTSFGIIFVSIFKICHLRPARRRMLLESEAMPVQPIITTPATPRELAAMP